MQQSPNSQPRISKFELDLIQDRMGELWRAVNGLNDACKASVHVAPNPDHFKPATTKEILFASQVTAEQALQEYTDNVNRNLDASTKALLAEVPQITLAPADDWRIESTQNAHNLIDKARNDFPLPQEFIDA